MVKPTTTLELSQMPIPLVLYHSYLALQLYYQAKSGNMDSFQQAPLVSLSYRQDRGSLPN